MFSRINKYLLTNMPLLWNTKVLWVLLANFILHLFFFVGGFSAIQIEDLQNHYSLMEIGGASMFVFSVLCSLLVLIVWLVFYLRNNAFKNWYIIGKWHLAKETLLILLIVFTSITFYESFYFGLRSRIKSFTNKEVFVKEVNDYNQGMAFLPSDPANYFILNSCGKSGFPISWSQIESIMNGSTNMYNVNDSIDNKIKEALKSPKPFSYEYWCHNEFNQSHFKGVLSDSANNIVVAKLVRDGNADAVLKKISRLLEIAKKYDITFRIKEDVFAEQAIKPVDPRKMYTVGNKSDNYDDGGFTKTAPRIQDLEFYGERYNFNRVLENINDAYHPGYINRFESLLVSLYITLGLGILFICYRRFTKKVFLISLVGSIVITILVSLFGALARTEQVPLWLLVLLFIVFTMLAIVLIQQKKSKTFSGVMLNWHMYLLPAIIMIICGIIVSNYHNNYRDIYPYTHILTEAELQKKYPVSFWINNHIYEIGWANIAFAFLYLTLVFNKLAKKWHSNPDE